MIFSKDGSLIQFHNEKVSSFNKSKVQNIYNQILEKRQKELRKNIVIIGNQYLVSYFIIGFINHKECRI